MKVFITGASGFIGSATTAELLGAGHQVLGLARSRAAADALEARGVEVHRGDLDDLGSLAEGAEHADAVIHLAYNHDFTDMAAAAAQDQRAIAAMGDVLEGTDKAFTIASGTLTLALLGRVGTEADVLEEGLPRVASDLATIALAERGVRSSVVRLSPSVHGPGDHGFVPRLIDIARQQGFAAYVGEGSNRWPAVHVLDAASLYRLAIEKAPAGTRLHGVGDEGIAFKAIATSIGEHLGVPVRGIEASEADAHFGFLGMLVQLDNPTSNVRTRELLGWEPTHPGLLADLDAGHYFAT